MKHLKVFLLIIFLITVFLSGNLYAKDYNFYLEKVWESDKVFKTPESVWYDKKTDALYISNINGSPSKKDDNGFISKVSTQGKIIKLKWATGLNSPKGLCTYKSRLYVTDVDRIAEIDLNSGKIIKFYKVEGAIFLNDIAADSSGTLYFSDTSGKNSTVYRLKDGKIEKWLDKSMVKNPNGLYSTKSVLYVGSSGEKKIKIVDIKTKKVLEEVYVGTGIDGLIPFKNFGFITSNWAGKTLFVSTKGKITVLLDTTKEKVNSADLGFVYSKNLLIIPTFYDNRIIAYKLLPR